MHSPNLGGASSLSRRSLVRRRIPASRHVAADRLVRSLTRLSCADGSRWFSHPCSSVSVRA